MEDPYIINNYKIINELGKGAFSTVFSCYNEKNNYALKKINNEDRFRKCALQEIKILKIIKDNTFIVKLFDEFILNDIQYIIFELLSDNLYIYYFKKKNDLNLDTIFNYGYQIAFGLSHLHELNIIHADLKLENIVLTLKKDYIKIIDLGSSILKKKINNKKKYYIQTRYYRSPEILYEINFNEKIDIWSYGVILSELLLKKRIFNGKNENDMIFKIASFIGEPIEKKYKKSKKIKLFKSDKLIQNDFLDIYLKNQLKNMYSNFNLAYKLINLFKNIFVYNYDKRFSADKCLKYILNVKYNYLPEEPNPPVPLSEELN